MKYKIIPEDVIKSLVEFLDDVQSEAAETKNSPKELERINFCSWAISQLINSTRAYKAEDEERPATKDEKWDIIDEYFLDFQLPEDMTKKEINKMMNQFEGFFKGWDKKYKETKHTNTGKKKQSLKQFRNNLLRDDELTPQEKFELYYEEYEKNKRKPMSLNKMLKKFGLRKSSGGSDTH